MSELPRQLAALIESAEANISGGYGQSPCGDSTVQILTSILREAKAAHGDNSTLQALNLQEEGMPRWSDVLAIAKLIKASLPLPPLM
jgi:hypothetical protein